MVKTERRLPAEERRRVVEEAAAHTLAELGYERASLEEIARRAGVTKPIVYRHFASKQALHLHLLATHRDGLLAVLAQGMAGTGPLEDRITGSTDAWFGYLEEHPFAGRLLFRDTTGEPAIRDFHEEMHAQARATIAGLLAAEPRLAIPDDEVEATAEYIRSAMTGLALWWAEHPELPRERLVGLAVSLGWRGISGRWEADA